MTQKVLKSALVDIGRRSFYDYCRLRIPSVYTKNRPHLKVLCDSLQDFIESNEKNNLIICMPPRFGKSTSVQLLSEWFLGHFKNKSIITASYNELLSSRASKSVRNGISEISAPGSSRVVFSDFFPGVKIKDGDGAVQMWSLTDSFFSYLATSPGGTVTGIGANGLMIVDDLIKNAYEANNQKTLEDHWDWYNSTMMSRCEKGCKKIVIMTRWSSNDLVGKLLSSSPEQWEVIEMKALQENGEMLCDDILTRETFEALKTTMDPVILAGNYQQEPFDSIDRLYGELKTYQPGMIPQGKREAYFDTADEGSDYLAGACYTVANGTAYITDIAYTQDPMEVTEGQAAMMLTNQKTQLAWIESNNGGRGFARNVERVMREIAGYSGCQVKWFHQGQNKQARILATSTNVMNSIIMPHDWKTRWPLFYDHVTKASRMAKLSHDDFADLLAGIVEKSLTKNTASVPSTNIRAALAI